MGETNMTKSKKSSKRFRTKYTKRQLEALETLFTNDHYPDPCTQDELADQLYLSSDKVSVWFQNRRSKFKRESKEAKVKWMREQIYDQENRHSTLCLPWAPHTNAHVKPPPGEKRNHVLSASQKKSMSTDDAKPSSNLHYKPSPVVQHATPLPLENGLNLVYTPQLPLDVLSCAGEILRENHMTSPTVRPEFSPEIQYNGYYGTVWSSYMPNPTAPSQVTSCMYSGGLFTTPLHQQITLL